MILNVVHLRANLKGFQVVESQGRDVVRVDATLKDVSEAIEGILYHVKRVAVV